MSATGSVRVASTLGTLGLLATLLVGSSAAVEAEEQRTTPVAQVHEFLHRAALAAHSAPHDAHLVVVSFSEQGPRIARLDVSFAGDDAHYVHEVGLESGPEDARGFLRSSSRLLQLGSPTQPSGRLDRLLAKYDAHSGPPVELDTGPAMPLEFHEREAGALREVLYADVATGLLVRRETFARNGIPIRTAAYTRVSMGAAADVVRTTTLDPGADPDAASDQRRAPGATGVDRLRSAGFVVPDTLPRGYDLLAVEAVAEARVPTAHLVYGDGMYTLSVFEQLGRMRSSAVDSARELRLPTGGAVWRWPGSEPRRIVWSGDDATYTAFGDAPPDELLEVVVGLPVDPPPSILDRLRRGFARLWRGIPTEDRSET